jgi:hypothetical protein
MEEDTVNGLFEALRETCQRQFGFEPNRISANMEYMGPLGAGQHRFRDTLSKSEIHLTLKPLEARLHERGLPDEPDWPEQLKAEYRKSDDSVHAEHDDESRKTAFARQSALWVRNRNYLRSLFLDDPTYQPGGPTHMTAATALLEKLAGAGDADFVQFSEGLGTTDVSELASRLLSACHDERKDEMWNQVRGGEQYAQLQKVCATLASSKGAAAAKAEKQARELAAAIRDALPRHLASINSPSIFVEMLIWDAMPPVADR